MNAPDLDEVIDLEEYSVNGERPPKGRRYRFRLDKAQHISKDDSLTGRQILAFGGMNPDQYLLFQAQRGGQRVPVTPDQVVDLTEPGVERFFTMKNEHNNGDGSPAIQDFQLPAEDLAFLRERGLPWEARLIDGQRWLIIRNWPIPQSLTPSMADMALRIDPNYPMAQIDMAYFNPALAHQVAGVDIPNLSLMHLHGETWQQWSRHRPPDGWRPGTDSLETHLAYVDNFLTDAAGVS